MLEYILLFLFLLGAFAIWAYIETYVDAQKKYGKLRLTARNTHRSRLLRFEKGEEYLFYKDGRHLVFQTETEHYSFFKDELDKNFKPTDLYGRLVLERMVNS